eukprot:TRINITY_DN1126_c0_g1_i1.p1 TRINITY_DN1126_c0_g1~~TRINITY_DN1126_c0_g1_i1.p1  ORF type:complete len:251 (-),score=50.13 TRINITY_DN1126_c0_g1_i1:130-882(-)
MQNTVELSGIHDQKQWTTDLSADTSPEPSPSLTPQQPASPVQESVTGHRTREGETDDREKKRQRRLVDPQVRLLQNRQSAARSRQRKKEYLVGLERKSGELETENTLLKQQLYASEQRIRALEQRLTIGLKQNDELQNLLKNSNKAEELQRILNIYSSLPIPSDLLPKSDGNVMQIQNRHNISLAQIAPGQQVSPQNIGPSSGIPLPVNQRAATQLQTTQNVESPNQQVGLPVASAQRHDQCTVPTLIYQ